MKTGHRPATTVAGLLIAAGWDPDAAARVEPRIHATLQASRFPCNCRGQGCKLPASDSRHGERNGYNWHGCRCRACTRANTEYIADLRAGRRSA